MEIRRLDARQIDLFDDLLTLFGEVFAEPNTYDDHRPQAAYLRALLDGDQFIALAALHGDAVVGGLAAYVLPKFEQQRSEILIYDLAVAAAHRRRGIATALIEAVLAIARERGAYLVFVQADTRAEDQPAIALYSRFAAREPMLHFEIDPHAPRRDD